MALQKGNWVKLEQKGTAPGARSSHAIAVVADKVYAFGGEFIPRIPVDNHLYVFSLNDQTWRCITFDDAKGDVPPPRVGVSMASIGETIYVFGGRDREHKELSELYSFNTSTDTWTLLPSGPPPRSYHSMAADDRRIYVFGGCGNTGRLNDLWAFDVADHKWIEFPSPGEECKPRGGPGLAAVLGKIWVVYGFSGVEQDDVHYFDLDEQKWVHVTTSGEKPTPRSVFSSFGLDEYFVIYGGEIDPSDLGHLGAGKFAHEVYALNTKTLVWEKWNNIGEHPGKRGWCAFSGCELNGEHGLLVYGGNSPSNDRLEDMYFFSPGK